MNVYDFDHTIYAGDSTVDFYFFCLKKDIWLLRYLPFQIWGFIKYKLNIITKTDFKEVFLAFLKGIDKPSDCVFEFWNGKQGKIEKWYLDRKKRDDLIISASPYFLLEEICRRMDVKLIATNVDIHTGEFPDRTNCFGVLKVQRYYEMYPEGMVDEFYSDSNSDLPMAEIAAKAFKVHKGEITEWIV